MKAFEVKTIGGVKFLLFPAGNGDNIHVVSESGNNWGSFHSLRSFLKYYKSGEIAPLGKMAITGRIVEEEKK